MKKKRFPQRSAAAVALAAGLIAGPTIATAQKPQSEIASSEKSTTAQAARPQKLAALKAGTDMTAVGTENGHKIYRNSAGKTFWIDPATGDQKFVRYPIPRRESSKATSQQWGDPHEVLDKGKHPKAKSARLDGRIHDLNSRQLPSR